MKQHVSHQKRERYIHMSPTRGGLLVGDMCICLSLFWWETCLYASPSRGIYTCLPPEEGEAYTHVSHQKRKRHIHMSPTRRGRGI
jgi:hypothetical protein